MLNDEGVRDNPRALARLARWLREIRLPQGCCIPVQLGHQPAAINPEQPASWRNDGVGFFFPGSAAWDCGAGMLAGYGRKDL